MRQFNRKNSWSQYQHQHNQDNNLPYNGSNNDMNTNINNNNYNNIGNPYGMYPQQQFNGIINGNNDYSSSNNTINMSINNLQQQELNTYVPNVASPMINGMPTPFDSAYGATLLPSHLLMGSPFVSTPNLPQQQQKKFNHNNNYQFNSNNNNNNDKNNNFGNMNMNNYNNFNGSNSNFHNKNRRRSSYMKMRNLSKGNLNKNEKFNNINYISQMESLFQINFKISYKILPKGDDAFRTRSLLLENIDKSIDIHSFISKFVRKTAIESIYIVQEDDERKDKKNYNLVLSFLTVQNCLNFYNNVLQRLKEFKAEIKSESLTLNFILLNYVNNKNTIAESNYFDNNEDNIIIPNMGMLPKYATRSIVVELKDLCEDQETFYKLLDFLNTNKDNKRYILESVYLFNTEKPSKLFSKNYAILTFLNIQMAIEMLDYLEYKSTKNSNIGNCSFVMISPVLNEKNINSNNSTEASETNSISNGDSTSNVEGETFQCLDSTNLLSSESSITLNEEVNDLADKLRGIDLEEIPIIIDSKDYPQPTFEIFDDHLLNISKSYPNQQLFGGLASALGTPRQSFYMNDMNSNSDQFSTIDMIESNMSNGIIQRKNMLVPQTPVGLNSPSFYMEQPPFKYKNLAQPITDTLENQFNTSAKVASAMGSDIGNRTIYIGNINPRSKVEDICNVVRGGILQNVKFIESKRICFVTFIEASAAVQFYANAFIDPIVLHGNTLKLGWGNYSGPLPKSIALAVTVGASRNVYVSLPEFAFKDKFMSDPNYKLHHEKYKLPEKEQLRTDFTCYGPIEQINYLSDSHCCWVNFMNINAAIKLVEDARNKTEQFNEIFNNRYDGLIINYGKDRCGNINRNLVAGKNSKFYKKVKRPSRNIRLSHLEERRRNQEVAKRENQGEHNINSSFNEEHETEETPRKFLPLDSLGISIENYDNNFADTNTANSSIILDEEDINNSNEDKDEDNESDSSNDVELIINSPSNIGADLAMLNSSDSQIDLTRHHGLGLGRMNENTHLHNKNNRNHNHKRGTSPLPPMDPNTVSKGYAKLKNNHARGRPNHKTRNHNNDSAMKNNNNNNNRQHHGQNRNARTIPGSDVMAQYLAQLQHSTFMYAANVLGASNEETEFLEE